MAFWSLQAQENRPPTYKNSVQTQQYTSDSSSVRGAGAFPFVTETAGRVSKIV